MKKLTYSDIKKIFENILNSYDPDLDMYFVNLQFSNHHDLLINQSLLNGYKNRENVGIFYDRTTTANFLGKLKLIFEEKFLPLIYKLDGYSITDINTVVFSNLSSLLQLMQTKYTFDWYLDEISDRSTSYVLKYTLFAHDYSNYENILDNGTPKFFTGGITKESNLWKYRGYTNRVLKELNINPKLFINDFFKTYNLQNYPQESLFPDIPERNDEEKVNIHKFLRLVSDDHIINCPLTFYATISANTLMRKLQDNNNKTITFPEGTKIVFFDWQLGEKKDNNFMYLEKPVTTDLKNIRIDLISAKSKFELYTYLNVYNNVMGLPEILIEK
jgi:hypothetical protein